MNKKYCYLIVTLLIIASCVAFCRIAGNDFINFDDNLYITENNNIKSGINSESIKWAFSTIVFFYWQPLTWLSHMLDWSMFGANASGHHIINLIFHIGSVILLFLFLNKATNNIWSSAFAAAFFALHPLRVESVAWAAERKDVLSMFFGMACIYVYVLYAENYKLSRYLFCLTLFALSLMSKPMMVTLPFVFLLLDYWPLRRWSDKRNDTLQYNNHLTGSIWREKIPFFLLTITISAITIWGQNKFGVVIPFDDWPISARFFHAIIAYVSYFINIFWPFNLAVFYPLEKSFFIQQIFTSFFILTGITFIVLYSIKKSPFLFVGWFWFLITLIPVLGFVQVATQSIADRFTYLPSIGIAIMLSWGVPYLFKKADILKKVLFLLSILVLIGLMILTWRQCGYWKNSFTLFSRTLQVTKNNAQAHFNLGMALFDEGKTNEAIYNYDKAMQIRPDLLLYFNRGNAYIKIGEYKRAIDDFDKAVILKPNCAEVYFVRGNAYFKMNQYQRSIEDYSKAILLTPDLIDAYNNRGLAYGYLVNFKRAIVDFNKIIRLKSNYAKAYNNRGLVYAELGQHQQALHDFNKAISFKHDYADAYNNRGAIFLGRGNKERGCPEAQKACHLGNCRTLEIAKKKGLCR